MPNCCRTVLRLLWGMLLGAVSAGREKGAKSISATVHSRSVVDMWCWDCIQKTQCVETQAQVQACRAGGACCTAAAPHETTDHCLCRPPGKSLSKAAAAYILCYGDAMSCTKESHMSGQQMGQIHVLAHQHYWSWCSPGLVRYCNYMH